MKGESLMRRPVGASVLVLNDFHHGKYLNVLNRAARLIPDDVRGIARIVANYDNPTPEAVEKFIKNLDEWADGVEQLNNNEQ
jgi:hypothetical protein